MPSKKPSAKPELSQKPVADAPTAQTLQKQARSRRARVAAQQSESTAPQVLQQEAPAASAAASTPQPPARGRNRVRRGRGAVAHAAAVPITPGAPAIHTHSLARALELANPASVITPNDWTSDIPQQHRRLDALARLLRLNTTICAAVAIHPSTKQLIVAINEKMDVKAVRQITGVLRALLHLHQDISSTNTNLTVDDQQVLYALVNQRKKYDYVLRVVDKLGTDEDLETLKRYYTARHLYLSSLGTLDETQREELDHTTRTIGLFSQTDLDIEAISNNERHLRSRYSDFLSDPVQSQMLRRTKRDIAKLSSIFSVDGDLAHALSHSPILLTPDHNLSALYAQIANMSTSRSYRGASTVHAEMQIAEYLLDRGEQLPEYIGISMHCCRTCGACMNLLYDGQTVSYRGESPYIFPNIEIPQLILDKTRRDMPSFALPIPMPTDRQATTSQEHNLSDSDPSASHSSIASSTGVGVQLGILEARHAGPTPATQIMPSPPTTPSPSEPRTRDTISGGRAPAGRAPQGSFAGRFRNRGRNSGTRAPIGRPQR